jgi:hypothetical protein
MITLKYMTYKNYHPSLCIKCMLCLKNSISWDVSLCSMAEVHRSFRGIYQLHLQG